MICTRLPVPDNIYFKNFGQLQINHNNTFNKYWHSTSMEPAQAPPSHEPETNALVNHYLILAIAIVAVFLLLTNIIITAGCCPRCGFVQYLRRCLNFESNEDRISKLIPACKYWKDQWREQYECAVCLSSFVDGEDIRQLPECKHFFHVPCIDEWLCSHSSCPICRAEVLPSEFQVSASRQLDPVQQNQLEASRMASLVAALL